METTDYMLNNEELQRYTRQIMVREIGEAGQEKLKKARVLIAGVGGLGSPIAYYLAAAGVGKIRIVDNDKVELTNLNRQIAHWTQDIGRLKVESAASKLSQLNDTITIEPLVETISESSISQLTADIDVILDATDNLATRFLLNKAAMELGMPFIHGAVAGFEGRLTTIIPGKTPCLGCIYHGDIPKQKTPVIGVTPAVIGALEATEAIKYIVGAGQLLTNQLLVYDGLRMRFTTLGIKKDPNCRFCATHPEK
jgi:molybdopterin-synthase adenylyltransferase